MSKERSSGHKGPWTRHTPGPWHTDHLAYEAFGQRSTKMIVIGSVENQDEVDADDDVDPKQDAICELPVVYDWDTKEAAERSEANARLIAAAPDLLEACTAMLDAFDVGQRAGPTSAIAVARAAIAKATGGAE